MVAVIFLKQRESEDQITLDFFFFFFSLPYFKMGLMNVEQLLDESIAHRGRLLAARPRSAPQTILPSWVLVLQWWCGKVQSVAGTGWSVREM